MHLQQPTNQPVVVRNIDTFSLGIKTKIRTNYSNQPRTDYRSSQQSYSRLLCLIIELTLVVHNRSTPQLLGKLVHNRSLWCSSALSVHKISVNTGTIFQIQCIMHNFSLI